MRNLKARCLLFTLSIKLIYGLIISLRDAEFDVPGNTEVKTSLGRTDRDNLE